MVAAGMPVIAKPCGTVSVLVTLNSMVSPSTRAKRGMRMVLALEEEDHVDDRAVDHLIIDRLDREVEMSARRPFSLTSPAPRPGRATESRAVPAAAPSFRKRRRSIECAPSFEKRPIDDATLRAPSHHRPYAYLPKPPVPRRRPRSSVAGPLERRPSPGTVAGQPIRFFLLSFATVAASSAGSES